MQIPENNKFLRQSQKVFVLESCVKLNLPFLCTCFWTEEWQKCNFWQWKMVPLHIVHTNSMNILMLQLFITLTSHLKKNNMRKKERFTVNYLLTWKFFVFLKTRIPFSTTWFTLRVYPQFFKFIFQLHRLYTSIYTYLSIYICIYSPLFRIPVFSSGFSNMRTQTQRRVTKMTRGLEHVVSWKDRLRELWLFPQEGKDFGKNLQNFQYLKGLQENCRRTAHKVMEW